MKDKDKPPPNWKTVFDGVLDPSVQRTIVWAVAFFLAVAVVSISNCAAIDSRARYDYLKGYDTSESDD